ncbi:LacI family DNA-binding transcriptional regulator [Terracidiphilus gabretensis]|uniref:LacI family DNA-binding transcriptional regulator n=1 Tax=Terracidiphilus gabretensis TaxID=1577687 RepID=UPI0009E93B59|nr:LacI family DNA-binding transcriptional regulator [Terracidiphilus gabretensis]
MAKGKDAETDGKSAGNGTAEPGHINLRMLAEHLGLSQTTISLVLNNSPSARSIPNETRERVRKAARDLNYRPNYFARSLRQSRSMSVGVLAPDLSEGYFTRVMSGVVAELTAAHYFYFTACHDWNKELIEQYPRMLVERAVDGFLLLNTPAETIQVPVPVVAISAHSSGSNVTNIVLDHESAANQALTHLYSLGHRNIAFMRGPRAIPDSEFRWESIQKVARGMGLKIDPSHVVRMDAEGWSMKAGQHTMAPEIGYRPMKALLERSRDFTAIFCFNDIAAIGAIRALKDVGLGVPDDVSVVGFDDIQSAAFSTPSLTTVRQPLTEMGRRGAQLLLERIAHKDREYAVEITMAPELIVRESTGAAKK